MRVFTRVLTAVMLPASLAAQQPAPAETPNPVSTAFRTRITAMHRNIAQAFDSIPESLFGYKPTPAQLSIGFIAQHVASDNYLFCDQFGEKKSSLPEKDTATPDSVKATWPKDTLVAKLKASFAFCQEAIGQLEDGKLGDQVTLSFRGQSRNVPRINMVLGHALDLADHYSQLANYMRLNGMLPPTALPRPRP
ncbi:MAG: DinB family protein [Gemmatimonadales bacterium]